jgi:hypothetical protein
MLKKRSFAISLEQLLYTILGVFVAIVVVSFLQTINKDTETITSLEKYYYLYNVVQSCVDTALITGACQAKLATYPEYTTIQSYGNQIFLIFTYPNQNKVITKIINAKYPVVLYVGENPSVIRVSKVGEKVNLILS